MTSRGTRPWSVAGIVLVCSIVLLATVRPPVSGAPMALQPAVIHVDDVLTKGLAQKAGGFSFSVLGETATGGVELFSLKSVARHYHPSENHFLYILKGRAKGQIANVTAEVGPGDLVVIPAGKDYAHQFQAIGSEPVVFLLFSTPPFHAKDIVWLQQ
jgi:quercetin dioxygenase-like cupin family protein